MEELQLGNLWRIRLNWSLVPGGLAIVPVCCFLVRLDDVSFGLIDAGHESHSDELITLVRDQCCQQGKELSYIFITHGHVDHVSAVPRLLELYPNCRVVLHEREAPFLVSGEKYRSLQGDAWKFNVAKWFLQESSVIIPRDRVLLVNNDSVCFANGTIQCVETPGHTPGSMSYLHVPSGSLMVGDVIMHYNAFNASCPHCYIYDVSTHCMEEAKRSVQKICQMKGVSLIYPGHDLASGLSQNDISNKIC